MAEFRANARAKVSFTDGSVGEVITELKCEGDYREWEEYPAGVELGTWTIAEQDEDLSTVEAVYPDEYEPYIEGLEIDTVLDVVGEPDWELVKGSQYDD